MRKTKSSPVVIFGLQRAAGPVAEVADASGPVQDGADVVGFDGPLKQ
jgi:hypothetical protein